MQCGSEDCMYCLAFPCHASSHAGLQKAVVHAGFPGVNTEFQELVKACAEAALETNDSKLKTKVRHSAFTVCL